MEFEINIGQWVEVVVDFIIEHFEPLLDAISAVIGAVAESLEAALLWPPAWLLAALLALIGLWRVGWRFTVFVVAAMVLIIGMNLWEETMSTMALVIAASFIALAIGMPVGVAMGKSDTVELIVRPVLDFMQTMPPFVYLIPAAMFFGLGKVPGTVATVVFAMPPAVRLTNLGIRQVNRENIEAGLAFGCTDRQLLFKVQLPLALPSLMTGVNQTIMMALSMVVIASMIGAGGLGNTVLTGIQRLDIGLGFEGGLGVVMLAILLDRITQSFGRRRVGPGLLDTARAYLRGSRLAEPVAGRRAAPTDHPRRPAA